MSYAYDDDGQSIAGCGTQPRGRTVDARTFELDLQVHAGASTTRLTIAIHDGVGGPGTYHVVPVHGTFAHRVYLADGVSESAARAFATQLQAVPGVVSVRYVSKDEAAAEASANTPNIADALSILGTNPLPAALEISSADTRGITAISAMADSSPLTDPMVRHSPSLRGQGISATDDPRGIGEVALYVPEAHATTAAAQPDFEGEGTLTLNRDQRSREALFAFSRAHPGEPFGCCCDELVARRVCLTALRRWLTRSRPSPCGRRRGPARCARVRRQHGAAGH